MKIDRMAYIAYFKGQATLKRLEKLPVNITFVSKRLNYVFFYSDLKQEKSLLNQIKNTKGFLKLEQSAAFDEQLNYEIE